MQWRKLQSELASLTQDGLARRVANASSEASPKTYTALKNSVNALKSLCADLATIEKDLKAKCKTMGESIARLESQALALRAQAQAWPALQDDLSLFERNLQAAKQTIVALLSAATQDEANQILQLVKDSVEAATTHAQIIADCYNKYQKTLFNIEQELRKILEWAKRVNVDARPFLHQPSHELQALARSTRSIIKDARQPTMTLADVEVALTRAQTQCAKAKRKYDGYIAQVEQIEDGEAFIRDCFKAYRPKLTSQEQITAFNKYFEVPFKNALMNKNIEKVIKELDELKGKANSLILEIVKLPAIHAENSIINYGSGNQTIQGSVAMINRSRVDSISQQFGNSPADQRRQREFEATINLLLHVLAFVPPHQSYKAERLLKSLDYYIEIVLFSPESRSLVNWSRDHLRADAKNLEYYVPTLPGIVRRIIYTIEPDLRSSP